MNEKKTQPTGKFQVECDDNAEELINKILKLQEREEMASSRRFVHIVAVLMTIAITLLVGYSIYKNGASTESVLSTLLALFSIFMSVFFYFKSDETSKSFYDSSYNFMKEASITLGRIEERFGEKLNNISEKMSHFKDASKKIDEEEAEKYHMIDSLIDKAGLGEKERAEYTQKLIEKDLMIRSLDRQRMIAIQEAENLRKRASPWEESENRTNLDNIYTRKSQMISMIDKIMDTRNVPKRLPGYFRFLLDKYDCIEEDGSVNIQSLTRLRSKLISEIASSD